MPTVPSGNFIAEKNTQIKKPIWLYRLAKDDNPAHDYFFAEYPTDVSYFKDTNTPQVYQAAPIKHDGFGENGEGKVEKPTITASNVSRAFEYDFQQNNRFKGHKGTVRRVFANLLSDPYAYMENIWFVDSAVSIEKTIAFTLASHADVMGLEAPSCFYARDFCRFSYKGDGCWRRVNGVLTADSGFTYDTTNINSQNTTAKSVTTEYPSSGGSSTGALVQRVFMGVDCSGLSREADDGDYLEVDVEVDGDVKSGTNHYFWLSSSTSSSYPGGWYWHFAGSLIVPNAINTLHLDCKDSTDDGDFNLSSVRQGVLWVETNNENVEVTLGRIVAYRGKPWHFAKSSLDTCDHSLRDCKRHGNQERFGGQPSIPIERIIRV